jgi:hypothetical protein
MCGTSITQIEKTYYHTTEEKMVSNALAGYYVKDGMIIPKLNLYQRLAAQRVQDTEA